MVNAQEWLDKNYLKEKRNEISKLDISGKNLERELDLSSFENLKELNCSENDLTDTNFLSTLPHPEKLTILDIRNNNFNEQNLGFLSKFTKLEKLYLGTDKESKSNNFSGCLRDLKGLRKLYTLDISNTNIENDWWHLPSLINNNSIIINFSSKKTKGIEGEIMFKNVVDFKEKGDNWKKIKNIKESKDDFWSDYGLKIKKELEKALKERSFSYKKLMNIIGINEESLKYVKLNEEELEKIMENNKLVIMEKIISEKLEKIKEEGWKRNEGEPWITYQSKIILLEFQRSELQEEKKELNNGFFEKEKEVKRLKEQLRQAALGYKKEIQGELDAKLSELENLRNEVEEPKKKKQQLQDHLQKAKEELQSKREILTGSWDEIKVRFRELATLVVDVKSNLGKLKESLVDDLLSEIEKNVASGNDFSEETEGIQKKLKDCGLDDEKIEGLFNSQKNLIELKMKLSSDVVLSQLGKLLEDCCQFQDEIVIQNEPKTSQVQKSSLQELENEKKNLESELEKAQKETLILQEKVNELEIKLTQSEKTCYQLATKLEEEKSKLSDTSLTEQQFREVKENIEKLEKELEEAKKKLEEEQSKVLNLQKELVDKERQIKRVRDEKQAEIDELQTEKDKLKLEFTDLQTKLEDNKKELKNKDQGLSNIKKELEKERSNKSIEQTKLLRKREERLKKEVKNLKEKNEKLEKQLTEKNQQIITIDDDIKFNDFQVKPNLKLLIGKGGYGEVYYGKWKLQDVAVKKLYLLPNNISQNDVREITNEINILKNLRNRHIIQYYGLYSNDQELLIIMDYAENGTLTKFIDDNKDKEHNWSFNTNLIKQMALGLAYIHHENIIHRDLKSMNILLADNYRVKISDFGLSKTKSSSQSKDTKGTLRWMAPEALKEKSFSEQSDIYSLGMVVWEIAAKCTTPFENIEDDSLVNIRIINGEKETIPSDTPENIRKIVEQCWKDDPNERISLENILEMIGNRKEVENTSDKEKEIISFAKDENGSCLIILEEDWKSINPNFTDELTQQWQNNSFTYHQACDWINTGLQPTDYHFASWLRDELQITPEQLLNNSSLHLTDLKEQFQEFQSHQELSPKN